MTVAARERGWGIAGIAVIGLALAVYAGVWRLGWTGWDDTAYVVNNPHMTAPDGLRRIWLTGESEQYYPLTFTSYWVQHRLAGVDATLYHGVNVVLHAVNAVLVLGLLRALGLTRWSAMLAAALFALHPTQVMSVAWVAEHKNVLSGFFTLVCMWAWVHGAKPGRLRWIADALALLAFLLAMLSKTAVVGLPISLLLLDRLVLRAGWGRSLLRIAPMLVIAAGFAAITYIFEQKFVERGAPEGVPGLVERIQITGAAPWAYLWRLAWPVGLSPAYSLWDVGKLALWWLPVVITGAVGLAVLISGERGARQVGATSGRGLLPWGVCHFMLMLGPSLGLIPFGNLAVTFTSDHFLYLASLGLFVPLAAWLDRRRLASPNSRWAIEAVPVLVLVPLALATYFYVPVYTDAKSMWTRGVRIAPDNYTCRLGLAEALMHAGQRDAAMKEYERALAIRPLWSDGHVFYAEALRDQGRPAEAERSFARALELSPANPQAMAGLAGVWEGAGRIEEALAMYERAVRADGANAPARLGLGKMYLGYARYADALAQFEACVRLAPDAWAARLGIATALRRLGRDAEAAEHLDAGLRAAPDSVALLNMLARLRATSRDDSVRDGPQAVALANRAGAAGGDNPLLIETLAAAHAECGAFEVAASAAEKAGALAAAAGDGRLAGVCAARAAQYRAGQPLRE